MRIVAALLLVVCAPGPIFGQELPETYPPSGERGAYYLSVRPADSVEYPEVYPNDEIRDSIDAQYKDHYEVARAIEQHALENQEVDFLREAENGETVWEEKNRVWNLIRTNGDTTRLDPKSVTSRSAHFFFEYYYPEQELVLFRLLYGKQVDFALISRKSGRIFDVFGPPVFSPSVKWFATFHNDGLAGWSPNGVQLFTITGDGIEKGIQYDMGRSEPGPTGLRWIDDSTFQIEMREHYPVQGGTTTNYEHYRIKIHRTAD